MATSNDCRIIRDYQNAKSVGSSGGNDWWRLGEAERKERLKQGVSTPFTLSLLQCVLTRDMFDAMHDYNANRATVCVPLIVNMDTELQESDSSHQEPGPSGNEPLGTEPSTQPTKYKKDKPSTSGSVEKLAQKLETWMQTMQEQDAEQKREDAKFREEVLQQMASYQDLLRELIRN